MASEGLTDAVAAQYEAAHGYNEITERNVPLLERIIVRAVSPISGMLLLAAVLSFFGGKDFDGFFILVLLVLNVGVTVYQEHKADTAVAALNHHLAVLVRTKRGGAWRMLPSRELVPGDLIELSAGNVVPADATVVTAASVSANEAALTGESLPKEKAAGDPLYSGSFLASGLASVEVTAIGSGTSFGKTFAKAGEARGRSALETDILRITRFLSGLSLIAVLILSAALLLAHASFLEVLRLDLSLVIAGIPISLPTVMTLIIALGVLALAKKNVIVRRLSSLEELANTDLLLTDKTGTLTKNHIVVNDVVGYDRDASGVRALGALIAGQEPAQLLNAALLEGATPAGASVVRYIPADSSRKRSTLLIERDGRPWTLSLGAPQVIRELAALSREEGERFDADVARFAARGFRTLALSVAEGKEEKAMRVAGLFALSDELREDAGAVVRFLAENDIEVAMVTGDNRAIATEIASRLRLPGTEVLTRAELLEEGIPALRKEAFAEAQAFAEILPEDKLALVERARRFYTVAVNGDGVNDLPAVKAANVGFAVANAVDALKGAADIVLLSPGIGVMKDAFLEGRRIFERLSTYALYRVSESFRLIVTIVILGLSTGTYPLTPLQLILLALLNDIPVISLASDRVRIARRPARMKVSAQFLQSVLYGSVGVMNSILLFFLATSALRLPLPVVETLFFLKLTVSGHLLIYVAHTKDRWWRFLPSAPVILATSATQLVATALALTGFLMPAALPWPLVLLAWAWSFLFMQAGELVKRRRGVDTPSAASAGALPLPS